MFSHNFEFFQLKANKALLCEILVLIFKNLIFKNLSFIESRGRAQLLRPSSATGWSLFMPGGDVSIFCLTNLKCQIRMSTRAKKQQLNLIKEDITLQPYMANRTVGIKICLLHSLLTFNVIVFKKFQCRFQ